MLSELAKAIEELKKRVAALESAAASHPHVNSAKLIIWDKELERVMAQMETIRGTYAGHQNWSARDIKRHAELRLRRDELRKLLGVKH